MNTELVQKSQHVVEVLREHRDEFHSVVPQDLTRCGVTIFDLTQGNETLAAMDLNDTAGMTDYLFSMMREEGNDVGIGRYDEDRIIYQRSGLFEDPDDDRSLHVGIDVWVAPGTPVFAPIAGRVHSFADNDHFGDYGPTIILEHELDGVIFYTLYGHLSRESLDGLHVGEAFVPGQKIATVGNYPINGDWPPHLHFQIMVDMLDKSGDFPGVASPSQRDYFSTLCPDPNLILRIPSVQ